MRRLPTPVVLFNGKEISKWTQRGLGGDSGKIVDAKWKVVDGVMQIVHSTGDLISCARTAAPARLSRDVWLPYLAKTRQLAHGVSWRLHFLPNRSLME